MIPALEQIIKRGSQLGVKEVVLGMAHRGRLNVLANFMGKPFAAIFSEFQGNAANPEDVQGSGDVKYHLGTSADREFDGARRASVADRQPVASRSGQPGRARQGARQAAPAQRQEPRRGDGPAAARRRRLRRPGPGAEIARYVGAATATGPAARSISSSTTRSASPPARPRRAPAPIAPTSPRASRRRSSTSTATTRKRWCMSRASPSSSARSSSRTWSSTCSATAAHGHNESDEPAFTQPLMYRTIAHPSDHAADLCRASWSPRAR